MKNILLIEDEEKVAEVIKAYLEKEGYKVYWAARGLEGIKIFNEADFKLVILDLMLPDMDGFTVTRRLRERGVRENAALIALTLHGRERGFGYFRS